MGNVESIERKMAAVITAARAILEKQTFAEAARAIFDLGREMTGAISGYVALLSADGQENQVLFLEAGGMPCLVDPELPMPIRGLRAIAYETHKTVYENDFMNSRWVQYMPEGHVVLRNVMFAPLNIHGKTVGIMGLANKPSDFTEADAEIASVLGELAAVALVSSRHIELLNEKTIALEKALLEVKTLRGLLPMCTKCKKIRDDAGIWTRIENYLSEHTEAIVSHGLCPECMKELYPEIADAIIKQQHAADGAERHG